MNLNINGTSRTLETDPERTLLSVLRNDLHLTGTKYGCGEGNCGACTVLIDGESVRACVTPVGTVAEREIITIEGLADGDQLHPVQEAFIEHTAFQCGYCTPGFIIETAALLSRNPHPTGDQTRAALSGHICRCGAYSRIIDAAESAAQRIDDNA